MIKDKDRLIFGNLREGIDRTARIQICDHNTGCYEDYRCIDDVSHAYDSRIVFGIGLVNSEYRNGISLMKSERGKHGMTYTEIGYVRAL